MDTITEKLPDNAKPDPKVTAQLEAVAKKNGFASYDEYNDVVDNISLVLGGFDPATKKYVGSEAVIKAQIAQVQADKKMSAKDKKEALADLNQALEGSGAADREQGQYRSRRQILRQARRHHWATTSTERDRSPACRDQAFRMKPRRMLRELFIAGAFRAMIPGKVGHRAFPFDCSNKR